MTPSRLARIAALACLCLGGCAGRLDPEWERFQVEEQARWRQARADARALGVSTPPDIPDQPVIRNIQRWDHDIAVTTEHYLPQLRRSAYRLWTADHASRSLRPFTGVSCASHHDVAHSVGVGRLLVCEEAGVTSLLRHVDGRWDVVAGAPSGTQVRVVSDDRYVVLASEQTMALLSASSFAVLATAPTPTIGPGVAPSAMLLTEDRLFVGFNAGEFGGALYRYDLAPGQPALVGVAVLDENVSALLRASGGAAWAATGLSHMGGVHGGLYRLDGRQPEAVVFNEGVQLSPGEVKVTNRSGVALPGLSRVRGLAPGTDGRPMFALPQFGVYELSDDQLVARYTGALTFSYPILDGLAITSSDPVGMVVSPDGEIFVGSRSLGVMKLPRRGRQLVQYLFTAGVPVPPR